MYIMVDRDMLLCWAISHIALEGMSLRLIEEFAELPVSWPCLAGCPGFPPVVMWIVPGMTKMALMANWTLNINTSPCNRLG